MAIFTTAAGIDDLTGKLSKEDRIVMRQKKYRLPNGKIEILEILDRCAILETMRGVCRQGMARQGDFRF